MKLQAFLFSLICLLPVASAFAQLGIEIPAVKVTVKTAPSKTVPDPVPAEPKRPVQAVPTTATVRVLAEPEKRNLSADVQAARKIKDDQDASRLIYSILGGPIAAKVVTGGGGNVPGPDYAAPQRLSEAESGRSRQDREESVGYLNEQFSGHGRPGAGDPNKPAQYREAPRRSAPTYYEGNRRIVRYSSRAEIPPILVANSYLDRVEVALSYEADYRQISEAPRWANSAERPAAYYQSRGAYSVSYQVDPDSAVSRDDILFRQGSTAFADAYSYDIVVDMAEALNQPNLLEFAFIIEGHASAEGSYSSNLNLSQRRAERIARELVRFGVVPERLLPVGYGESEAAYLADGPEQLRRLDRRVMIFRME